MVAKNGEARQWWDTNRASIEKNQQGNIDMKSLSKAVSEFTIFKFGSHEIRVVTKNGDPWFVAKDVCDAIGLTNSRVSLQALDDDEKGVSSIYTPGGMQDIAVVSESGMFTLILRCRDAVKFGSIPHQFRKWVTGEVLPAVRKTGEYKQPGKRVAKNGSSVNAADLLSKLNLICSTWDAARVEITQFDPAMASRLDSTMSMFWMYTMNMKGIASKKKPLRLN